MAVDADTTERTLNSVESMSESDDYRESTADVTVSPEPNDPVRESDPSEQATDEPDENRGPVHVYMAVAVSLITIVAGGALAGWFGYHLQQERKADSANATYLTAARQAALNLTTIDAAEADADIKRVLDSAVGTFHDEFQKNSASFADTVRQAQAKTVGTVTEAGIESVTGDSAQTLVAVSVKSTLAGKPDPQPRLWRMRITVQRQPDGVIKVANVGFVP